MNKKDYLNLGILSLISLIMLFLFWNTGNLYGSKTDSVMDLHRYFRNLLSYKFFPNLLSMWSRSKYLSFCITVQ